MKCRIHSSGPYAELIIYLKGVFKELQSYDTLQLAIGDIFTEVFTVSGGRQEKVLQNALKDLFPAYKVFTNAKKEGGLEYH